MLSVKRRGERESCRPWGVLEETVLGFPSGQAAL